MLVLYVSNFLEKESKVIGFRKARELRCVMQANIIEDFDAGRNEAIKEALCVRFGEADYCNVNGHDQSNSVWQALLNLAQARDRQQPSPLFDRRSTIALRGLRTCPFLLHRPELKAFTLCRIESRFFRCLICDRVRFCGPLTPFQREGIGDSPADYVRNT